MERTPRVLEAARLQRQGAEPLRPPVQRAHATSEVLVTHAEEGAAPAHARVVALDRAQLRARRLLLPDEPGPAAHAYRMLRTQILQQVRAHKVRTIGIVSAIDGEGKTLTAMNLALSLAAEPNQTVLLADLDLRKPSIASLVGLTGSEGLESWFAGRRGVAELFVRLDGIDRLRILPTFSAVPGSSEALASARTHELLAELKSRYSDRLTIFDLPPALLADDVLTIASELDGVLIVVSERRTLREDLMRVRELLGPTRVLGSVLNHASESERRAY